MRIYRFVSVAIGSVLMAGASSAAFAGCYSPPNCTPRVVMHPTQMDAPAPINVYNNAPFGYLKTFEYKNTPNVNIIRIGGCSAAPSPYCSAPVMAPRPVMPPPINVAPVVHTPRITVGNGYNAANFAPRQYGSTDFVPGIAHIPTSIVDRSPITHIGGVPQPQVRSVTTATMSRPIAPRPVIVAPFAPRRVVAPVMTPRPNIRSGVLRYVNAGSYTYQPEGGGGQYWEKTSGPTMIDGMFASKVLCRRQAPRPAPVRVNVVRPVIGVPHPVPTPVPVVPMCAGAPMQNQGIAPASNSRYGSRWTY
ncbi:MAG: hypothetical protein V3U57_01205 [Robiginitomaculum sp.]